ncbi:MAG: hypothetical protein LBE13_09025, partial [Bacteroidales bacterium]|nr:hypothetical protein [Bacteroidales bacterium]
MVYVIIILILLVSVFFFLIYKLIYKSKHKHKIRGGVFTKEENKIINDEFDIVACTLNNIILPEEPIGIIADNNFNFYTSIHCFMFFNKHWGGNKRVFNLFAWGKYITNFFFQWLLEDYFDIANSVAMEWYDYTVFPSLEVYIGFMRKVIPLFLKLFRHKFSIIVDTYTILFSPMGMDTASEFHERNILKKFKICFDLLRQDGFIIILYPIFVFNCITTRNLPSFRDICCLYHVELIKYLPPPFNERDLEFSLNGIGKRDSHSPNLYIKSNENVLRLKSAHGVVLSEELISEYYDSYFSYYYKIPIRRDEAKEITNKHITENHINYRKNEIAFNRFF